MASKLTFRTLDLRAKLAIGAAAGLMGLGADAAVSHFAGRDMRSAWQLVPVLAAPLSALLLAAVAVAENSALLRRVLRGAGALMGAVGLLGTALHGSALLLLMEGTSWRFDELEAALAVAPPLAAPGAFAALGALLYALASDRLRIELRASAA